MVRLLQGTCVVRFYACTARSGFARAGRRRAPKTSPGHPSAIDKHTRHKHTQAHFESKHPAVAWDESKVTDLHAMAGGVTTQGVAVRGSKKK